MLNIKIFRTVLVSCANAPRLWPIFMKCETDCWCERRSEVSYRSCWLYSRSWHARGYHHPRHHGWHHAWHLIKEASWNIHLAFPYHLVQADVLRSSVRRGTGVWTGCVQLGGGETTSAKPAVFNSVITQLVRQQHTKLQPFPTFSDLCYWHIEHLLQLLF